MSNYYKRFKKKIRKKALSQNIFKVNKVDNPIRWGIVGLGYMADQFSYTIRGSENSVLSAVASRSIVKAKNFAKKNGRCLAFGTYNELLINNKCEIDIVYIPTPLHTHFDIIKTAILNDINVLCEKPIVESSKKLKELISLAKERNVFLMEGMWMKCLPTIQLAIKKINANDIGNIQSIKVDFNKMLKFDKSHSRFTTNDFGGVLYDYGVYAISFVQLFLGGAPEIIHKSYRKSKYDYDTDWNVILKQNDTKGIINISSNFDSSSFAIIIGDKGYLQFGSAFNRSNILNHFDTEGNLIDSIKFKYEYDGFEYQLNEVVNCLKNNKIESTKVSHQDSLETLKILQKLKD